MKSIASAILLAFLANGQAPQSAAPQTTASAPKTTAARAPQTTAAAPQTTAAGSPQAPPSALPPIIPPDAGSFECAQNLCQNRIINVVPGQAWSFKCAGNCAGATINIDVGLDPLHPGMPVDYIDSITCSQPYSCVGMTINIMNTNHGVGAGMIVPVELNDLRCEGPYSCTGLILNAYQGVDIFTTNFDCQTDVSCAGCIVRDAMKLEACNQNQNPNGQLMMPWQIPGTGQQPQGPYMPAHQTPMLPPYVPKNPAPPMGVMNIPGFNAPAQPQQPAQPQPYPYYPQQPQQPPQGYPYYPQQYPYGQQYPQQYPYGYGPYQV